MSLSFPRPQSWLMLFALAACRGETTPLSQDPVVVAAPPAAASLRTNALTPGVEAPSPAKLVTPEPGAAATSVAKTQVNLSDADLQQIKAALVQAIRASEVPRRDELLKSTESGAAALTERGFRIGSWVAGKEGNMDAQYKLTYRVFPGSADGFAAYVAHASLIGGTWSIRGPSTQVIHSRR